MDSPLLSSIVFSLHELLYPLLGLLKLPAHTFSALLSRPFYNLDRHDLLGCSLKLCHRFLASEILWFLMS